MFPESCGGAPLARRRRKKLPQPVLYPVNPVCGKRIHFIEVEEIGLLQERPQGKGCGLPQGRHLVLPPHDFEERVGHFVAKDGALAGQVSRQKPFRGILPGVLQGLENPVTVFLFPLPRRQIRQ